MAPSERRRPGSCAARALSGELSCGRGPAARWASGDSFSGSTGPAVSAGGAGVAAGTAGGSGTRDVQLRSRIARYRPKTTPTKKMMKIQETESPKDEVQPHGSAKTHDRGGAHGVHSTGGGQSADRPGKGCGVVVLVEDDGAQIQRTVDTAEGTLQKTVMQTTTA